MIKPLIVPWKLHTCSMMKIIHPWYKTLKRKIGRHRFSLWEQTKINNENQKTASPTLGWWSERSSNKGTGRMPLGLRLLPFCFRQNSLTGVCFYMNKFFTCFFLWSGAHLLSHIVSNAVPSAAQVLTVVFGMGTGVSPKRITTRNVVIQFSLITQQ